MAEDLHPVQVEGFRRMTPAQKLRMVAELYEAGIRLRIAGLRMALRTAFPENAYYVPPDETLRLELARTSRGMFNLIHHASHTGGASTWKEAEHGSRRRNT
jgi:hypothetical protein